jgi:hypothetical protein
MGAKTLTKNCTMQPADMKLHNLFQAKIEQIYEASGFDEYSRLLASSSSQNLCLSGNNATLKPYIHCHSIMHVHRQQK